MKVKELIEKLQQLDPELDVFVIDREDYPQIPSQIRQESVAERYEGGVLELYRSWRNPPQVNLREAVIIE